MHDWEVVIASHLLDIWESLHALDEVIARRWHGAAAAFG